MNTFSAEYNAALSRLNLRQQQRNLYVEISEEDVRQEMRNHPPVKEAHAPMPLSTGRVVHFRREPNGSQFAYPVPGPIEMTPEEYTEFCGKLPLIKPAPAIKDAVPCDVTELSKELYPVQGTLL